MAAPAPAYDVDFYGDAFIADPLPHYARMRALGPVVWLPRHGNYAVTRYAALREAMRAVGVFRSGEGVAADDAGCTFLRGNTLASDPPTHTGLRKAIAEPLLPGSLETHRPWVQRIADELAASLRDGEPFDGVARIARHLPLTVVSELVGLPEDGRDNMLPWAAASFDILGVQNARGQEGIETIREMRRWIDAQLAENRMKPGSWTARILEMGHRGEIAMDMCPLLIRDYINPSLDTTISATAELLFQLARESAQWDMIRNDPGLVPRAVDEAVRLATPIRSFSRTLAADYTLAGVDLPQGARAMMLFASANRDEAHFADPDRFDVTRRERDHVGFGHGIHTCVGMHLAKLEMSALLHAFIPTIRRFRCGTPTVAWNNTIRSFETLPMTVELAAADDPVRMRRRVDAQEAVVTTPGPGWIDATVASSERLAETVVGLRLVARDGGDLPAQAPGAHIDVELAPDLVRQYSIVGATDAPKAYEIAVNLADTSRGGSAHVHGRLKIGDRVRISAPRNNFPLYEAADRYLLIAGGIGITPLLPMARRLHALGKPFELIYRVRSRERAAFLPELETSPLAGHVTLIAGASDEPVLPPVGCPQGLAVYCCGPAALMDAVRAAGAAASLAPEQMHFEAFGLVRRDTDAPFEVTALRSGVTVTVPGDGTMLSALEAAGVVVQSSCLSGACGTCLVPVMAGEPDHRDSVQTAAERAGNARVALCCSRALTDTLVVDI